MRGGVIQTRAVGKKEAGRPAHPLVRSRATPTPAPRDHRAAKVCELYPWLEESGAIEAIIPKKETGALAKWCVCKEGSSGAGLRRGEQRPLLAF